MFRSHLAGSKWQERDTLGDLLGEKVPERDVRTIVGNHMFIVVCFFKFVFLIRHLQVVWLGETWILIVLILCTCFSVK